jgi:quercetin dioxygenase-like cupin family protein
MGNWIRKIVVIGAVFSVGTVVGEALPPKENRGVKVSEPVVLDLAPWAHDMKGRQLRIRKLDIAPGGVIALHSHDDRPDVSYLVEGTLTELRAGGFLEVRPGDTLHAAGKGVTHWVENRGSTPAVLIVADLFRK